MNADQLRYADGPTTEASTTIAATPAAVWSLVSDIQLPARFSTEFQGADWLDGVTGAAAGNRFVGRNAHPATGSWETTAVITEFEPDHRFGYVIGEPAHPSSAWRFTIEPAGEGITLTHWMRMGPASSGINYAIEAMPDKEHRILERRLAEHRSNMEATLAGIKALAETA